MFFSGRDLFVCLYRKTTFVIYNVYCVLKCGIPAFFLYHGNTNIPSGSFRQILSSLKIVYLLYITIVFKKFSLV